MNAHPIGQRWHWTDVCILAASLLAALVLLHVIASDRDSSIPPHPVACVQHALPDRGLPACDGSGGGYPAQVTA